MQAAIAFLQEVDICYAIVNASYTPALQDIQMMQTLHQLNLWPDDWIIIADTDELFTYGRSTITEALALMEQENASYAMGETLDHVSRTGKLTQLEEQPSLWEQYPMICPIISQVARGLAAKVTVHKAFLRSGAGHHHIVDPALAKAYFGKQCTGEACELVMKTYKQRSTVDLYKVTPYYMYRRRFRDGQRSEMLHYGWGKAKAFSQWTKNHHFKWHTGLQQNLYHRVLRDSGDCVLGVNEDTCSPKFQFWQEVARQYAAISSGEGFNISELGCQEGVETLWNW